MDDHGHDIPDQNACASGEGNATHSGNAPGCDWHQTFGGNSDWTNASGGVGGSVSTNYPPTRRYLPTLADLIDRLTIVNQKLIFLPERQEEYLRERQDILHDIDLILNTGHPLSARAVLAITMVQLTNRYIWENEAHVRNGGSDQGPRLMLTHSINGIRNSAKNMLSEEVGGRHDYKVDCLAEDLPADYGNWKTCLKI